MSLSLGRAIRLRQVADADLPLFYAHQADRSSIAMAGVPGRDQEAFTAHWKKIRADPTNILRTILHDKTTAGYAGSFIRESKREVCYWLGREFWGKGIASRALKLFLAVDKERPLWTRVVKSNAASVRVIEKCGFTLESEGPFKTRDGRDGEEFVLILKGAHGKRKA